mmetsp:Transcript_12062/g.22416  ORF Transcript_12062/g.22416 Transcript_12062/m.22416 type:complete len:82 (+) Transcript_12062:1621-1866(+)
MKFFATVAILQSSSNRLVRFLGKLPFPSHNNKQKTTQYINGFIISYHSDFYIVYFSYWRTKEATSKNNSRMRQRGKEKHVL